MCLISFAYQQHPKYSLILIANRDEFYQRPTASMAFWEDNPQILAGKDLQAGGTWLGINVKNGTFSALTNIREGGTPQYAERSRGQLTEGFLQYSGSAEDYLTYLTTEYDEYNGFNLLLADQQGLYHTNNRQRMPQKLAAGSYGLSNATLNTPWPKTKQLTHALEGQIQYSEPSIEALLELLRDEQEAEDHQLPSTGVSYEWEKRLSACYIRSPEYGTRCSTVLMQRHNGETTLVEISYQQGKPDLKKEFQLQLTPIG